jgi:hypothetical protein
MTFATEIEAITERARLATSSGGAALSALDVTVLLEAVRMFAECVPHSCYECGPIYGEGCYWSDGDPCTCSRPARIEDVWAEAKRKAGVR